MSLRTVTSLASGIVLKVLTDSAGDDGPRVALIFLKISVVTFTIPYYMYFLVSSSLLFSVWTFYKTLRNNLFPDIMAED